MADIIRKEAGGALAFGDYTLGEKAKVNDFEANGGVYSLRAYKEITKLECNDSFVYESVPGTNVSAFLMKDTDVSFSVTGSEDAEITLGLEPEQEYDILLNGADAGKMKTNLGGKLTLSVELEEGKTVAVEVKKA